MMDMLSNDNTDDFDDEDLFSSVKPVSKMNKSHNSDDTIEEIFLDSSENIEDKPLENPLQSSNLVQSNSGLKLSNQSHDSDLFPDQSQKRKVPTSQSPINDKPGHKGGISESKSMDNNFTSARSKDFIKQNGHSSENKNFINISVLEPKKTGDGINAFVVYKIITKTDSPDFRNSESEVVRRFREFLGLHEKLSEKYLRKGRIIPQPPEKNAIGTTKLKITKEEAASTEFVEQRRAALERFLNSIAKHPSLRSDPSFVDFLEVSGELPRAASTSALSGAGVMRLFGRMGDTFSKMTYHMEETDQWFAEKIQQVEIWEGILRNLSANFDVLFSQRKELSISYGQMERSVGALGSVEENTGLSRALSQLADTQKQTESIYSVQSEVDFYQMAEVFRDQLAYLQSIKDIFNERVKCYKVWKDEEVLLNKRREVKVKLELARRFEKIPTAEQEVLESEQRLEKANEDFQLISKTIMEEVATFEVQRYEDLKSSCIAYMEALLIQEEEIVKCWTNFHQEASSLS